MIVSFDTAAFKGRPTQLVNVLSGLSSVGQWPLGSNPDVEEIVCRKPSSALKYCQEVVHAYGLSAKGERVFLRNPGIGVRYLRLVGRSTFTDADTQRRFWRKVTNNAKLAYEWSKSFGHRLPEDQEMVFSKNLYFARMYAVNVIRGPFPEKVHQSILLRSFENLDSFTKMHLSEYIKFAEAHGAKNLETTPG